MSKEIKISSFDQTENHLITQRRQLEALQRQQGQIAEEAKRAAQSEANRRIAEIRVEQQQQETRFNNQVTGLSAEMANMNRSHQSAIQGLRKESITLIEKQGKDFDHRIGNLQDWTKKSLDALGREFQESMDELSTSVNIAFEGQQKQIDEVRTNVERLYDKEANEQKRAELMLKDLRIMVEAIDQTTLHQKYMPDRLNQLNRRLQNAENSHLPAAATIAAAHGIMNDLFDLQENIIKEQIRFEAFHNAVLNAANELLGIMRSSKTPVIKDDDGNEYEIGEINYWTNGEYSKLQSETEAFKEELETGKSSVELNEKRVKEILERISAINLEQAQLIELAIVRGLASEDRVKIGEDIIIAMENQGYFLQKLDDKSPAFNYMGGETENDQREGIFAVLKNGVGTEITVIIHPNEDLTKNNIIFNRNDNLNLTEEEYTRQLKEIGKILKNEGYDMGDLKAPAGTGDHRQIELADPNALSRTGIKKELKKRLGLI
jgi:hypothetical protein